LTLDEAFAELGTRFDAVPAAAMQCLLDHWDAAGPRCCALLHAYVAGHDESEETQLALYPILHLLGEKMETAAFADICALVGDAERADLILGDAVVDALPRVLISCFAGDTAPLRTLVERPEADPLVRDGALMAMAYLTQIKSITRAEMQAYLVALYDIFPAEPDFVGWLGWVLSVATLGFPALSSRVKSAFERGLIGKEVMGFRDFQTDLRRALEEPGSLDVFFDFGLGPLGSAIAALEAWDEEDVPAVEPPVVNPMRDVGRNDPCPCGSGKKFKKCCLGAPAAG